MDPIERQDAINTFMTLTSDGDKAEWCKWVLEQVPPAPQPKPHWILCSERLPEDGERVLATHLGGLNPDRQVIEHIYKNGKFTCGWDMDTDVHSPTFGQRYMGKVVAWRKWPEPYKGESEE